MNTAPRSPLRIFETLEGFQRTAALKAAIELDLFTAIGEGTNTASTLAKRCSAAERGIRILADYRAILGLLEKQGEAYLLASDGPLFSMAITCVPRHSIRRGHLGPSSNRSICHPDGSGASRRNGASGGRRTRTRTSRVGRVRARDGGAGRIPGPLARRMPRPRSAAPDDGARHRSRPRTLWH